ncbi:Acetyltransferase (GNAT) family protein [Amycolatopsis sp. YIM 10]|nr:Acetyltransferase (GNAT) family protein [Amycolatopsis sp. YIM 10]
MLTPAVYEDSAHAGCLLVARHAGEPIGYALFRKLRTRSEISLTHLCVRADHRHRGVAKMLVEDLSGRHHGRSGIRAKCRDDYPGINRVWRSLGFDAIGSATGRGADKAPMTVWWRDHAHPNLFTPPVEEGPVLAVAIDANVLLDLHVRPTRPEASRSQVLLAPDLRGRLEMVVPAEGLEKDVAHCSTADQNPLLAAAALYPRPSGDPVRAQALFATLLATVEENLTRSSLTEQDRGDLWQLAHTVTAGVKVFVTWDYRLRTEIAPIVVAIPREELTGVRIISPDSVVRYLDELAHAAAYQPRSLEGSQFSTELARVDGESELQVFLNKGAGETRRQFRERLQYVSRVAQARETVRASDTTPVAHYGFHCDGGVLRVELLRVTDHPIAQTMTRRLLWLLRQQARDRGAKVVEIADPYVSDVVARAAGHEAYQLLNDRWYAWVIDRCGSGPEISAAITDAHALVGVPPAQLIKPRLPAVTAAEYERTWWPAKITDSALPSFAVAIQPRWSADLLGVPRTLTGRATELALGREQVYYRSGHNNSVLKAPARILWYMSHSPGTGPGSFIGTSLLDATEVDTPENLHRVLAHYGVFRLEHIRDATSLSVAQALRFSDTEIFRHPVSFREYGTIRAALGGPKSMQSPCNVPPATFAEVYARGRG